MADETEKSALIEKYVEDTIIEYLQSQQDVPEFYSFQDLQQRTGQTRSREESIVPIDVEKDNKILFIVEEIINDILHDVDRTILYQQHYGKRQEEHHQYPLFNLVDFLPEFYIDDKILRKMCFRETLMISNVDQPFESASEGAKPLAVGGMCLKIERAYGLPSHQTSLTEKELEKNIKDNIKRLKEELSTQPGDPESDDEKLKKYKEFLDEKATHASRKFIVHLSSEFDLDGANAGSSIVSWVDKDFHTLEERRKEFVNIGGSSTSQTLYYALQENQYYIRRSTNLLDEPSETRKYCPLSVTKDMIGEGANFVLMRYLAISKYKGQFEMTTFYIDGSICRNIYECKGPRPGFINGHPVDLCKIYRTIIEKSGLTHISVTIMTIYGMIVCQEWDGCPYIIQINPHLVTVGKPAVYDYVALKKVWDNHIRFVSKYMDCMTEAELKMKTYQKDHPEIKEMLADYLQSILLLKPENILPFTQDYFMSFEPYRIPTLPYFEDQKPDSSMWY